MMIAEIDSDGSGTVDFDGKLKTNDSITHTCEKLMIYFVPISEFMEVMTGGDD